MLQKMYVLIFLLFFAKSGICQTPDATANKMVWSPTALSFSNYTVVDNVDSLPYNPYLANTNLSITYYYKLTPKDSLVIYIDNLFIHKGSWIKKEHIHDNVLLKHEQGHFDLSEIYARKLAIAFSNYRFTNNYKQEIKQVAAKTLDAQTIQQERYDTETNYGENKLVQKKWNETIHNNLSFSQPVSGKRIIVAITNK